MTSVPTARRRSTQACALAFLTAGVTLFTQVLVHRMVSAKLLNNYAFLVISLTMLGFALSGVVLTRALGRFLDAWPEALTACAAGFVVTSLAVSVLFYHLAAGDQFNQTYAGFLLESGRWISAALLFVLPFAFCGLILGALLSDPGLSTPRVYGFDLAGSAAGAFAVIPAIRQVGVESSLLLACSVLLVGTAAITRPRRRSTRALVVAALVAVAFCASGRDWLFRMRPRAGSMLVLGDQLGRPYGMEYLQWDPVARIEVTRVPPPDPATMIYPPLIGDDTRLLQRIRRVLTQNDFAFTYMLDWDGDPASLQGVERTMYAAAYEAGSVRAPRVLVVGVGGGFDVLTALRFGASEVTGVEINAATLDIVRGVYRDYCGSWSAHPRVRLVHDEGRHYLASRPDRYDVLQLAGVDSYSGTAGAAHVFSESYLYTEEAFDLYLSRLTDSGILDLMRLEHLPPRELLRALVTAVAALRRAGIASPADHVIMLTARPVANVGTLLVKKTPFTPAERARVAGWAAANPFFAVSAAPGGNAARANLYQWFLELRDPARERAFLAAYPYDISPASDDRPFFFKFSSWSQLWARGPGGVRIVPVMEVSLLLLGAAIALAALVCVWLPLRLLVSRGATVPARARFGGFFAAIGIGYFAIEIALLQRFGLFLGHPNYALSVVLAALLTATGAGALLCPWLTRLFRNLRYVSYALAAIVLLERVAVLPRLPALVGLPLAGRAAIVFALVVPLGVLLGVFLPHGIERLKAEAPLLVPWAWGINGVFSVLAPVLAVALSVTWGMDVLLVSALPVYMAAGWLLPAAQPAQSQAAAA